MAKLAEAEELKKLLNATFAERTPKVLAMLVGLEKIYDVRWSPVVKKQGDQVLAMIMLAYPVELMQVIVKEPKEQFEERLLARGCKVGGKNIHQVYSLAGL
jgi:hypothetical protein